MISNFFVLLAILAIAAFLGLLFWNIWVFVGVIVFFLLVAIYMAFF